MQYYTCSTSRFPLHNSRPSLKFCKFGYALGLYGFFWQPVVFLRTLHYIQIISVTLSESSNPPSPPYSCPSHSTSHTILIWVCTIVTGCALDSLFFSILQFALFFTLQCSRINECLLQSANKRLVMSLWCQASLPNAEEAPD